MKNREILKVATDMGFEVVQYDPEKGMLEISLNTCVNPPEVPEFVELTPDDVYGLQKLESLGKAVPNICYLLMPSAELLVKINPEASDLRVLREIGVADATDKYLSETRIMNSVIRDILKNRTGP